MLNLEATTGLELDGLSLWQQRVIRVTRKIATDTATLADRETRVRREELLPWYLGAVLNPDADNLDRGSALRNAAYVADTTPEAFLDYLIRMGADQQDTAGALEAVALYEQEVGEPTRKAGELALR